MIHHSLYLPYPLANYIRPIDANCFVFCALLLTPWTLEPALF
jgi:hypothetical protein